MTRVTFGVSASSFAVYMSLQQNAEDLAIEYPLAAKAVYSSFYVDDGLTGADSVEGAITLQGRCSFGESSYCENGSLAVRKY